MSKSWYQMKAEGETLKISIMEQIGRDWLDDSGVSAKDFIADLEIHAPKASSIELCINCPGGLVFDGLAIYQGLYKHHAKLTVKVVGLAASMASVIMLSGDTRLIGMGSQVMIHDCWGYVRGNSTDMRKEADILDKIMEGMLDIYADRTGLEHAEVKRMCSEETWLGAKRAIELGFADGMLEEEEAAASISKRIVALAGYKNVPSDIVQIEPTERELEQALRSCGCSQSRARGILAKGYHRDDEEAAWDKVLKKVTELVDRSKE